jgi:hypothetical protein
MRALELHFEEDDCETLQKDIAAVAVARVAAAKIAVMAAMAVARVAAARIAVVTAVAVVVVAVVVVVVMVVMVVVVVVVVAVAVAVSCVRRLRSGHARTRCYSFVGTF